MLHNTLLVADCYLLGLAVTVQIAIYPHFAQIGSKEFRTYHSAYSRSIVYAVAPAWLLQGICTAWWLCIGANSWRSWAHAIAAVGGVVLTLFGAVPQHNALAHRGFQRRDWQRLLRANEWRCIAWALCVLLAL